MGVQWKLDASIDKKWLEYIQDLPNFQELQGSVILYGKNRYLHQIFHNISNINGILYFMKYLGAKTSEVLFDGELNTEAMETFWGPKSLRPDGVIMKDNKIVFLETDCWTHKFETLQEKSDLYKKLLDSKELQEMGFTDISIVIQSYSRRIYAIKKNGCMDVIHEQVKYLDFLDNEFQYMSQSWPSESIDMKEYRWLSRAIQKAKKQWEDGIELLWKKEHGKSFRDPVAFCNKVKALQWKYVDMEDSQDGFEPVADFEADYNKRELTSELWVSRKNSEDWSHQNT